MESPFKSQNLDPLIAIRPKLVADRRAAALEQSLDGIIRAQNAIDVLDRALADELKAPH
jgi:hypothetical protein